MDHVLRTPGEPFDAATRAYFEPRFGRDFSDVRVHAVVENDYGAVEEVDISNIVRAVYPKLKVGEAATATLEVFMTGFEGRCEAEDIIAKYLPRHRPRFLQKIRDISTLGSGGFKEFARR